MDSFHARTPGSSLENLIKEYRSSSVDYNGTTSQTVSPRAPRIKYPTTLEGTVDDLVDLEGPDQSFEGIVDNLRQRWYKDQPYTFAGPTLLYLSETPRQQHKSEEENASGKVQWYSLKNEVASPYFMASDRRRPPHAYAMANRAFTQMKFAGHPQAILITGESGTGKTTMMNHLLDFFTNNSVQVEAPGPAEGAVEPPLEKKLQAALYVIDCLSSASCPHNVSSTRCSISVQLKFSEKPQSRKIVGAHIRASMLERERLTVSKSGERLFHIFTILLRGTGQAGQQHLRYQKENWYRLLLNRPPGNAAEDRQQFPLLMESFDTLMWSDEMKEELLLLIGGILSLGNIKFIPVADGKLGVDIGGAAALDLCAYSFGIPRDQLLQVLTMKVGSVPLSQSAAESMKRTLISTLYEALFYFVVAQCNHQLAPPPSQEAQGQEEDGPGLTPNLKGLQHSQPFWVSLYDFRGFENFPCNRQWQFYGNFLHEKLQWLYQQTYSEELDSLFTAQGLKAPEKAEFKDHSGIVDLFSRPETGIWDMIRNRSMKVTMNDSMFHKQFMTSMSHQARYTGGLLIPITSREAFECGLLTDAMANQEEDIDRATDAEAKTLSHLFVVRHSPGDILYTTSNMLSDNRLRIPQTALSTFKTSDRGLLRSMSAFVQESGNPSGPIEGLTSFRSVRFLAEVDRLLRLDYVTKHFIRCIRPAATSTSEEFDNDLVARQLKYMNIVPATARLRNSFVFRLRYKEFFATYCKLLSLVSSNDPALSGQTLAEYTFRERVGALINHLFQNSPSYMLQGLTAREHVQYGKDTLFTTEAFIRIIEDIKESIAEAEHEAGAVISAAMLTYTLRRRFLIGRFGAVRLQALFRGYVTRQIFHYWRWCAYRITDAGRTFLFRRRFLRIRSGIKTLSRKYQMHVYSHKLYRLRTAVRQLHSLASGFMLRQRFQHRFQALKLIQRAVRKFLQRCHAHWYRVRAAILLQALWRGYVARSVHWNLVRVLRKRIQAKIVMLRIIRSQALWRGYTTRSKFQYLRHCVCKVQAVFRMFSTRRQYYHTLGVIPKIQAAMRGFLAREWFRTLRETHLIEEERWRVQQLRERELLQLACANEDAVKALWIKRKQMIEKSIRNPKVHPISPNYVFEGTRLVNVDCVEDLSDIYPNGWTSEFRALHASLHEGEQEIQQLDCGDSHTLVLSSDGRLFSWGWNDRGQLGLGSGTDSTDSAVRYSPSKESKAAGSNIRGNHSTFLASLRDSDPYPQRIAGDSASTHLFGPSSATPRELRYCQLFQEERHGVAFYTPVPLNRYVVTQISCGNSHSIALTKDEVVFSWGSNTRGQLGHGTLISCSTPREIAFFRGKHIRNVSAGAMHSAACSTKGSVYCWGAFEAAGHGMAREMRMLPAAAPAKDEERKRVKGPAPTRTSLLRETQAKTRRERELAERRVIVQTLEETPNSEIQYMATRMQGRFGNLPVFDSSGDVMVPQPITSMKKHFMSKVTCGLDFTVALSVKGGVWCWGANANGQLGVGHTHHVYSPERVWPARHELRDAVVHGTATLKPEVRTSPSTPPQVRGYTAHTKYSDNELDRRLRAVSSALTGDFKKIKRNGEASPGKSPASPQRSQATTSPGSPLGRGLPGAPRTRDVPPSAAMAWCAEAAKDISAGSRHMAILTESGHVFTTGLNADGQLGTGDAVSRALPTLVRGLGNATAMQIGCGARHTAIVTAGGALVVCGACSAIPPQPSDPPMYERKGDEVEQEGSYGRVNFATMMEQEDVAGNLDRIIAVRAAEVTQQKQQRPRSYGPKPGVHARRLQQPGDCTYSIALAPVEAPFRNRSRRAIRLICGWSHSLSTILVEFQQLLFADDDEGVAEEEGLSSRDMSDRALLYAAQQGWTAMEHPPAWVAGITNRASQVNAQPARTPALGTTHYGHDFLETEPPLRTPASQHSKYPHTVASHTPHKKNAPGAIIWPMEAQQRPAQQSVVERIKTQNVGQFATAVGYKGLGGRVYHREQWQSSGAVRFDDQEVVEGTARTSRAENPGWSTLLEPGKTRQALRRQKEATATQPPSRSQGSPSSKPWNSRRQAATRGSPGEKELAASRTGRVLAKEEAGDVHFYVAVSKLSRAERLAIDPRHVAAMEVEDIDDVSIAELLEAETKIQQEFGDAEARARAERVSDNERLKRDVEEMRQRLKDLSMEY